MSTNINITQTLLSLNEATAILGVKPNTIEVWISTKRYPLKYVKIGRLTKFRHEDLQEFIANNIHGGADNDK